MQIINSISALRGAIREAKQAGKTIGLVPTMGYLHQGHLSLMHQARQDNDMVVATVFVNPKQFGPHEDLETYPRDTQRDIELMQAQNVDIAFLPEAVELYPENYTTYVEVQGPMTKTLCGASRPDHFKGVTTIVAKLFHLTAPQRAYFGQKDAQQATIIRQMVGDLNFDLQIVVCPTIRESDGLAMSSRNSYLTAHQRRNATVISRSLFEIRDMINAGETKADVVKNHIISGLEAVDQAIIDYVAVVDANTLADLDSLGDQVLIAVAAKFGNTRLIDNIQIDIK